MPRYLVTVQSCQEFDYIITAQDAGQAEEMALSSPTVKCVAERYGETEVRVREI